MNPEVLAAVVGVALTAVVLAIGWLAKTVMQNARHVAEIPDLRAKNDLNARDITRLDEAIKRSPSHEDLDRIHDRISKCNEGVTETRVAVAEMSAHLVGLRKAVDRLTEVHLDREGE